MTVGLKQKSQEVNLQREIDVLKMADKKHSITFIELIK